MRPLKSGRTQIFHSVSSKTQPLKLTIDLPSDDSDTFREKLNKNSPNSKRVVMEIQKNSGSVLAPKHKSPSVNVAKKIYSETGGQRPTQKVFRFPPSPKGIKQANRPIAISRNPSKKVPGIKYSVTPTSKQLFEETKKRPRTAANSEKNLLKPETGNSPNLAGLVTQVQVSKIEGEENRSEILYKEHLFQTFQAMKFVRTLPPVNLEQLKEKRVNVPRRKGYETKKTLVFDLDETLVHCCEDPSTSSPDVVLPILFPTGEVVQAGINIRPYALECLKEVNKDFEVFVFTASHPCYANVVLDYLDPKKELIHHRFFRDSCINMGGVFIKDLRIFANRDLKDLIIVDNAAYSFAYQLDNGIPIVSWHEDRHDKELFNLIDYVKALACVDDIRDINEQTFHMRTFYEDYINEFLTSEPNSKISKKN